MESIETSSDAQILQLTSDPSDHTPVRLKDQERTENPRKRFPSDSPSLVRKRKEKFRQNNKSVRGCLEFSCGSDEEKVALFDNIDLIKKNIGGGSVSKMSNYRFLTELVEYYKSHNKLGVSSAMEVDDMPKNEQTEPCDNSFQFCEKKDTDKTLFLTSSQSLENLLSRICWHDRDCQDKMVILNERFDGHVAIFDVACQTGIHKIHWTSSPHVEGGQFLANLRMAHGYFSSGILPNQYERICDGAGIGKVGEKSLSSLLESYKKVTDVVAKESISDALQEEIAASVVTNGLEGIDIATDARHCWRKNAKFTDVICLGDKSHKVLKNEVLSKKEDDEITVRHEMIGTQRIYEYFDEENVPIRIHSHDSNASITKYVREKRAPTRTSLDTWHMTKGIAKGMAKLTKGKKHFKEKSWFEELSDKAASIKTHVYWSIKRCEGDPEKIKAGIDSIILHYQSDHTQCHQDSPCRADPEYEPSKEPITSQKAEDALRKYLHGLAVYKHPELFMDCRDTHYVESFNNSLLQFHDKRIVFEKLNYEMRSNLSVIDWNEHQDQEITSTKFVRDSRNPRRKVGRDIKKAKTFVYRASLWNQWMDTMYSQLCPSEEVGLPTTPHSEQDQNSESDFM